MRRLLIPLQLINQHLDFRRRRGRHEPASQEFHHGAEMDRLARGGIQAESGAVHAGRRRLPVGIVAAHGIGGEHDAPSDGLHALQRTQRLEQVQGMVSLRTKDHHILAPASLPGGIPDLIRQAVCFRVQHQKAHLLLATDQDLAHGCSEQSGLAAAGGTQQQDMPHQLVLRERNLLSSGFITGPHNKWSTN